MAVLELNLAAKENSLKNRPKPPPPGTTQVGNTLYAEEVKMTKQAAENWLVSAPSGYSWIIEANPFTAGTYYVWAKM